MPVEILKCKVPEQGRYMCTCSVTPNMRYLRNLLKEASFDPGL